MNCQERNAAPRFAFIEIDLNLILLVPGTVLICDRDTSMVVRVVGRQRLDPTRSIHLSTLAFSPLTCLLLVSALVSLFVSGNKSICWWSLLTSLFLFVPPIRVVVADDHFSRSRRFLLTFSPPVRIPYRRDRRKQAARDEEPTTDLFDLSLHSLLLPRSIVPIKTSCAWLAFAFRLYKQKVRCCQSTIGKNSNSCSSFTTEISSTIVFLYLSLLPRFYRRHVLPHRALFCCCTHLWFQGLCSRLDCTTARPSSQGNSIIKPQARPQTQRCLCCLRFVVSRCCPRIHLQPPISGTLWRWHQCLHRSRQSPL